MLAVLKTLFSQSRLRLMAIGRLIQNECRKNWLLYLLPLPIYLALTGFALLHASLPLGLSKGFLWAYLVITAIMALVYGLQCFSSEADKQTLDFLLTRPLSALQIAFAKYFTGFILFLGWIILFNKLIYLDFVSVNLPRGMSIEWLTLLLLVIYSSSFFSGLLARGLERFFVITIIVAFQAWASYYLWNNLLELVTANYYWYDIPAPLFEFLRLGFPVYLGVICLLIPWTGVLWHLKSRIKPWRFPPFQWLTLIWVLTFLLIIGAERLLAPIHWPDLSAQSGAWHEKTGIVTITHLDKRLWTQSPKQKSRLYLALAKPYHRERAFYSGINLNHPRFSPDGAKLLFNEDGVIMIFDFNKRGIQTIGPGNIAAWSNDGTVLLIARPSSQSKNSTTLYLYNVASGQTKPVGEFQLLVTNLVYDSQRKKAYLAGEKNQFTGLELTTNKLIYYRFPEMFQPLAIFRFVKPTLAFDPQGNTLLLTQAFDKRLRILQLSAGKDTFTLSEDLEDARISAFPPIISEKLDRLIWRRFDGTFFQQATDYYIVSQHHHTHEHEKTSFHQ